MCDSDPKDLEQNKCEPVEQLGRNDVKLIVDDCHKKITESDFDLVSLETDTTASLTTNSDETLEDFDFDPLEVHDQFNYEAVQYRVPTAKVQAPNFEDLMPTSFAVVGSINKQSSPELLRILFDSGGKKTMIHQRALPKGAQAMKLDQSAVMSTLAGTYTVNSSCILRGIKLPELDKNRIVDQQEAYVFNAPCRYDIILGNDFLQKAGIDLKYSTGMVEWYGTTLPMRLPPDPNDTEDYVHVIDDYLIQMEDEYFGDDWMDQYLAQPILDAKYDKTDVSQVAQDQEHLTEQQKDDLRAILKKHEELFSGKLGLYPHKKVHIELEEGAKPVHARPYPVPHVHMETFEKELNHLVALGVLSRQDSSEWASPTFIIPKKMAEYAG